MTRASTAWLILGLLSASVVGCAPGAPTPEECAEVTTSGDEASGDEASGDEASGDGAPSELGALLVEVLAPRICDQVRGAFVGLPGEGLAEVGAAAGQNPVAGRWWLRRCDAAVDEGRLRVSLAGVGWTWLDRESSGFRVRQYLRFDADATFSASLRVGYDQDSRIASVWLTPAPGVSANIEPRGLVEATATNALSSVLGGLLDITGNSASAMARTQAAEEGSAMLRDQLQTGFTATFDVATEQLDYMLGRLEPGVTPVRPWAPGERPWLINERAQLFPGGLDVLGPIPQAVGASYLDIELEAGAGIDVRQVCEAELSDFLDGALASGQPGALPGTALTQLVDVAEPRQLEVPAQPCRSMLIVTPAADAASEVRYRYRIMPTTDAGIGALAGEVATPTPREDAPGRARRRLRLRLGTVSVRPTDQYGSAWDVFGGRPDLYVVVSSIPRNEELTRTPVVADATETNFDRPLPSAIGDGSFPIRVTVYDDDLTTGDVTIGTADLERRQLPRSGSGTVTLELRTPGERPVTIGTVRLQITVE